jgi:hypothetical protein
MLPPLKDKIMIENQDTKAIIPSDADLIPFGWAPGDYLMVCPECREREFDGAKRRLRCRACAVVKFTASQNAEPTITHTRFSEIAGRLAVLTSSWSSDNLTFPEKLNEPMESEKVMRFISKARELLQMMEDANTNTKPYTILGDTSKPSLTPQLSDFSPPEKP